MNIRHLSWLPRSQLDLRRKVRVLQGTRVQNSTKLRLIVAHPFPSQIHQPLKCRYRADGKRRALPSTVPRRHEPIGIDILRSQMCHFQCEQHTHTVVLLFALEIELARKEIQLCSGVCGACPRHRWRLWDGVEGEVREGPHGGCDLGYVDM